MKIEYLAPAMASRGLFSNNKIINGESR